MNTAIPTDTKKFGLDNLDALGVAVLGLSAALTVDVSMVLGTMVVLATMATSLLLLEAGNKCYSFLGTHIKPARITAGVLTLGYSAFLILRALT